jgi:hypothetical protein
MKIISILLTSLTTALFLALSPVTHAEIINNNSFTTDTQTGLDWLDVTETVNQSYNEVRAQLEKDGKYYGFRYATAEEFNTFIGHYTGEIISQTQVRQVLPEEANIDYLMRILGSTQKQAKRVRADSPAHYPEEHWARMLDSVTGITINGQSSSGYVYIGYSILVKSQDFGTDIWHYSTADINKYVDRNYRDPEVGSFLVRDTFGIQSLIDQELEALSNKP